MTNIILVSRILLLLIISLNLTSIAFSQKNKIAEITAEGNSKLKVKPDIVTFTLSIEKTDTTEKGVLKKLNEEVHSLSLSLEKLGFENKSIKVSDYKISSSLEDEEHDKQKRYSASNVLSLEFRLDNKLIDALYKEVETNNFSDLEIEYETGISDSLEKSTRNRLVQLAIEDAKGNASVISKQLGLTISKIRQVFKESNRIISLSNEINMIKFTPPKVVADTAFTFKTSFDKFQVEEKELEEKITIIYEVSN